MTLTYHLSDIEQASGWLLDHRGSAQVICFHGEMGSGKTTLIKSICIQLGAEGSFGSPTFPIIHEYGFRSGLGSVFHMDLYRLADREEAERAGVCEALDSGSFCLVEWPEKVPEIIPSEALHVQLEVVDTEQRSIHLLNK